MTEEKRFLPLFEEEGRWVSRPDLYVLVRMSMSDHQGTEDFEQAYHYIAGTSTNTQDVLNGPQAILERQYVSGYKTERRYAAMVLLELVRLSVHGEKPTLGKALKLVVRYLKAEKPFTQESSFESQAKAAFRKWRNTCHLEAAFRIGASSGRSFEANPEEFESFLAAARALEMFMDDVCAQGNLRWNPWRVPEQIKPSFAGSLAKFTEEEQALIAKA